MFGPGEESKEILIKIVDDDMSEPDVAFGVVLTAASIDGGAEVWMCSHLGSLISSFFCEFLLIYN